MAKIKVTTSFEHPPLERQIPGDSWGKHTFFINKDIAECDFWVVFEGLNETETVTCKKGGKILFTGEPPAIKKYDENFLQQFDYVVTSHKKINHDRVIRKQQSLPWFVGMRYDPKKGEWLDGYSKDFNELKEIESVEKTKLASVICSDKAGTSGQRKRLRFLKGLKKNLGDRIDFFGGGFQAVPDKWDAIAPYKYHICLENTATKDYWTEKISDSYLGLSYPIYWGCTNINDYFSEDSYAYIDVDNPDKAVQDVKKILDSNTYRENLANVKKAKDLVLDTYNFFPNVVNLIENSILQEGFKKEYKLHPERSRVNLTPARFMKSSIARSIYGRIIDVLEW